MPYSDRPNDYWFVEEDDTNDLDSFGYIVTTYPHPLSEHPINSGGKVSETIEAFVIAHCDFKDDAEMIASLLNRAGVRRPGHNMQKSARQALARIDADR